MTVHACLVVLSLAMAIGATTARAAEEASSYPSKRVTVVVGFAPGGFADTLARFIAQKLQDKWGQNVIVENRDGAGGGIAARYVANAEADGYTILATTTALAINETLYKQRNYKLDEFAAIAMPGASAESLATHPSNPGNLKDFLAWAKNKGEISYGTAGVGSGSHIAAEYFFTVLAKVKAIHIPFRGGAPAVQAAVGKQTDAIASSFGSAQQVNDGKLAGLAVAGTERSVAMPQVPTYEESGFKGFVAESWVGFFAPAKTDPTLIDKLNRAINEIINDPENSKTLNGRGYQLKTRSTAESQQYLLSEVDNWGKMVKAIGVTVE
jgi:tripartite-type tricarboxylate transporter receptor subunit TctC